MSNCIQLNVGGQHFKTTREILIQSPYFEALLNRWSDQSGQLTLDEDPKVFREFLALLEEPYYSFPEEQLATLDYYQIEPPLKRLYQTTFSMALQQHELIVPYLAERTLLRHKERLYYYNSEKEYWSPFHQESFREEIRKAAEVFNVCPLASEVLNSSSIRVVEELNSKEYIAFANGKLNWKTKEFTPRLREDHFTCYYLNEYHPDSKTEDLLVFLQTILGDDYFKLQPIVRKAIVETHSIWVTGSKSAGKTSLCKLIQNAFTRQPPYLYVKETTDYLKVFNMLNVPSYCDTEYHSHLNAMIKWIFEYSPQLELKRARKTFKEALHSTDGQYYEIVRNLHQVFLKDFSEEDLLTVDDWFLVGMGYYHEEEYEKACYYFRIFFERASDDLKETLIVKENLYDNDYPHTTIVESAINAHNTELIKRYQQHFNNVSFLKSCRTDLIFERDLEGIYCFESLGVNFHNNKSLVAACVASCYDIVDYILSEEVDIHWNNALIASAQILREESGDPRILNRLLSEYQKRNIPLTEEILNKIDQILDFGPTYRQYEFRKHVEEVLQLKVQWRKYTTFELEGW